MHALTTAEPPPISPSIPFFFFFFCGGEHMGQAKRGETAPFHSRGEEEEWESDIVPACLPYLSPTFPHISHFVRQDELPENEHVKNNNGHRQETDKTKGEKQTNKLCACVCVDSADLAGGDRSGPFQKKGTTIVHVVIAITCHYCHSLKNCTIDILHRYSLCSFSPPPGNTWTSIRLRPHNFPSKQRRGGEGVTKRRHNEWGEGRG